MSAGQESTLGRDGKHACKVEWLGGRERKQEKEEMSIKTQASIKGSGSPA